jgi:hypothetical protein
METKTKSNTDVAGREGALCKDNVVKFVEFNNPTQSVNIPEGGMPLEQVLAQFHNVDGSPVQYSARIRINSDAPEKGKQQIVMPNDVISSVQAVEGGR